MSEFVVKRPVGRPPIFTKEERRIRDRENHKRRRLALQFEINCIKHQRGCLICGAHEGRLEFHHPDGVKHKKSRLSNIQTRNRALAELERVIVLCGACHRAYHNSLRERNERGQFCCAR